jgi:hypothetical protein
MEIAAGLGRLVVFLALLLGSVLAFGAGLSWLYFRARRRNAEGCAMLAASRLGLTSRTDGDPSVPLWQGQPVGQTVIVAAHAWASLDERGPLFPFFATPMVAIAAPFQPPLQRSFTIGTAPGAAHSIRTGDLDFDLVFRLDGRDEASILALVGNADVRRGISRLMGERTFWSGSGRNIEITHHGVLVRETMPHRARTPSLAADVLAAALAIRARETFL